MPVTARWSSVHAHLKGEDDGLGVVKPVRDRVERFADLIAADADAVKGLEARTATARVVLRCFEQTHHSCLDQILDFHLRWQTAGQMVGNTLDQVGMFPHQRVQIGRGFGSGISADAIVHFSTFSFGVERVSMRSMKNSNRPLGPAGIGH